MPKRRDSYWIDESIKNARFEDYYKFGPELGRGVTSIVYKCIHIGNGTPWAVKVINKRHKPTTKREDAMREIGVLLHLNHPNLIRMKEVFETGDRLHIVLEFAKGGELFDSIAVRGFYSEKDAARLVKDLVSAMKAMHDSNIIHRNLKVENLLLEDLSDSPRLKVADFGLSVIDDGDVNVKMVCAAPGQCPPEMFNGKPITKAVDSWMVGVIAYTLLCGYEPFYEPNLEATYKRVIKADYNFNSPNWQPISENAKDFVSKMLRKKPKDRLTAEQALRHPWVTGKAAKHEHLNMTHEGIKEFNAKRKFKALTDCVLLGVWAAKLDDDKNEENNDKITNQNKEQTPGLPVS